VLAAVRAKDPIVPENHNGKKKRKGAKGQNDEGLDIMETTTSQLDQDFNPIKSKRKWWMWPQPLRACA